MAIQKFQTMPEFLVSPFHKPSNVERDNSYNATYSKMFNEHSIVFKNYTIIEDTYYINIGVPSETHKDKKFMYDVVIRFFPETEEVMKQTHLRNYKIQFFSNSPSFMYKYAYLYRKNGYLIDKLYDKIDSDYKDVEPKLTNAEMQMSYDKSIYIACRYLSENKFVALNKGHLPLNKKVSPERFFKAISDFKTVQVSQTLLNEERKLQNNLKKKKPEPKERKLSTNKNSEVHSITVVQKKTGKNKVTAKTKIVGKKKIH